MLTEADIKEADKFNGLTPAYFCAVRVAEQAMAEFEPKMFDEIIKKAVDKLTDGMRDYTEKYVLHDAELNIQGAIYRMVDDCVKYLLSGERWAIEKYLLSDRYDLKKVREEVAKHVPKELQDIRLIELQEEHNKLKEDYQWLCRR